MILKQLIKNIKIESLTGPGDINIKDIARDSDCVKKGSLFVAIKGSRFDGNDFIDKAISNGAVCVLSNKKIKKNVTCIKVKDVKDAYSKICSNFYNNPSGKIKVIGITGTNGKTTTSYLIEHILSCHGYLCGRIGTIDYSLGKRKLASKNTTPDSCILQALFAKMRKQKINYCLMEVSSHAIDQKRINSVRFHSAVFTNLTREHLDYHVNMQRYFRCKKKLFSEKMRCKYFIVNTDDSYGRKIAESLKGRVITYAIKNKACFKAEITAITARKSEFIVHYDGVSVKMSSGLIGAHNIYNIISAVAVCAQEGVGLRAIKRYLKSFTAPKGRLEPVLNARASVFIDYAHTPDALKNVLGCLLKLPHERIITVFGCGGERDRQKRPVMGKIAEKLSDEIIITNDNPRSEPQDVIISEIKKGILKTKKNIYVIKNRKLAIKKALSIAKKNDIVLIAGKGHENYQIFRNKRTYFNDKENAKAILKKIK